MCSRSYTMQCTPGNGAGQRSLKNMPIVGKGKPKTGNFSEELMLAVVQDAWRIGKTVVCRPVRTGRTTTLWHYYGIQKSDYKPYQCLADTLLNCMVVSRGLVNEGIDRRLQNKIDVSITT